MALIKFLKETKNELKKVKWGTRKETIKATATVISFSAFLCLFIWITDVSVAYIVELLFRK